MEFNFTVSVGDIIAFGSLIGSVIMFVLTFIKQSQSKSDAKSANSFYTAAEKYYDMMVQATATKRLTQPIISKASCTASVVKTSNNNYVLKISNKGDAIAQEVNFRYIDEDSPEIESKENRFPIKFIDPENSVDFFLAIHLGLKSYSWEYELSWAEENGTISSKKGVLTLPLS